jgi:hypothetical protein
MAFRERHNQGAMALMSQSVSIRTNRKYDKNWGDWARFLSEYLYRPAPDEFYMQDISLREQVRTINAFAFHCAGERTPTLRASTIACVLSGIKSHFRKNLLETNCFDHPSVRNVKVALALQERKNDPLNVATQQKLPMTLGMTLHIAALALVAGDIDSMMTATAIQLAFACLLRVGEYVVRANDINDECCHALLVADVWFEVACAAGPGSDFICACDVTADMWDRVLLVKMVLRHMKNDRLRVGSSFWYKNHRGVHSSVNIVQVVFDWAVRAALGPDDFFFSHYQKDNQVEVPEVRNLTVHMVETAIKRCAVDYDLDPKRFGSHSPRVGGATTLRAGDASQSTVMHAARWRSESAALTYQDASSEEFDRIQRILQDASLYTTNDLRILQGQRDLRAITQLPPPQLVPMGAGRGGRTGTGAGRGTPTAGRTATAGRSAGRGARGRTGRGRGRGGW